MKLMQINNEKITLELSEDELGALGNAINKVCHGIKVLEFKKRIGNIEKAKNILRSLVLVEK